MFKTYIVKYIINRQFYVQNLPSKRESLYFNSVPFCHLRLNKKKLIFLKRIYDTSMGTCIFK